MIISSKAYRDIAAGACILQHDDMESNEIAIVMVPSGGISTVATITITFISTIPVDASFLLLFPLPLLFQGRVAF